MHRLALGFSRNLAVLCLLGAASGCGGDWGAPLAGRVKPGAADPGAAPATATPSDPASDPSATAPSAEPSSALTAGLPVAADAPPTPPSDETASSTPAASGDAQATDPATNSAGTDNAPPAADDGANLPLSLLGTPERPQLDATTAARFTVLEYLAQAGNLTTGLVRDDWDPTAGLGDVATFTADYRVAARGGTHTTVQAAISAAVAAGGTDRLYISVAPGTYPEVVCVPAGAPPITLYGTDSDASRTSIVAANYAGKAKAAGTAANPCNPNSAASTYGTAGSATFTVNADDFQAKNLSLVNQATPTSTNNAQAVALLAQGDRDAFENVRALGNQDTLLVKSPDVSTVTRAYFKDSYFEGDTDFICGRGTLVLDGCEIHSLSTRTTSGVILAPSTDDRNAYGILVTRATFTADANAADASIHLGRAWDENQSNLTSYTANVATGIYPNGQAMIRESTIGAHIVSDAPWRAAASTSRPYASVDGTLPANRFYEYTNLGPGSAPAP